MGKQGLALVVAWFLNIAHISKKIPVSVVDVLTRSSTYL